jgi:ABC-2 type transport system permease protein
MVKSTNKKGEDFLKFAIGVAVIILVNIIAGKSFYRFDLTEEKRYSISEATKNILGDLDDVVYVDVYLEGDFPAAFKRLQKSIKETLDEFRVYAGDNIQYNFIDPQQAKGTKAQNEFFMDLASKGIQPTNLFSNENGKKTEKLIFPGALIAYGGMESGVMLFKGNKPGTTDEILNQSIESIEFELASAIRRMAGNERKKVALVYGHGELDSLNIAGINNALLEEYDVFKVNLPQKKSLGNYDAALFIKPQKAFAEEDKYKIDQFIMNGGKVLFFVDALGVNMDSAGNEGTYAFPYNLNLDDQLFRYGVRINQDYVLDLSSGAYPVVAGNLGNQPQIKLLPWPFFPVLNNYAKHPIVRNMDAVQAKFVSSIDTVKADGVRKTPLILSSPYSRKVAAPVKVSFNDLRKEVNPEHFKAGPQPLAYLLEGKFTSLYKNRFLPEGVEKALFKDESIDTKVLVVSDGDFLRNDINYKNGQPLPLGLDQFTQQNYANQEFALNALAYMLDEEGVISSRAKEVKIRPLDKIKIQEQKLQWQLFNLVLPVVLILIYGVIRYFIRKRKYSNF